MVINKFYRVNCGIKDVGMELREYQRDALLASGAKVQEVPSFKGLEFFGEEIPIKSASWTKNSPEDPWETKEEKK